MEWATGELKQLDARFPELDTDVTIVKLLSIHFHRAKSFEKEEVELNAALRKVLNALIAYLYWT